MTYRNSEQILRDALQMIVQGNPTCDSPEAQCAFDVATAKAALDATENVMELDRIAFNSLCEAAAESKWIPPEYFMNDWVSDCRDFLINGPQK